MPSFIWLCGIAWMFVFQSNVECVAVIPVKEAGFNIFTTKSISVECYGVIPVKEVDFSQFAKSHTEFGLDLYKKAANAATNENIFFSPLSISFALGLLHLGAKGSSLDQINRAYHFNHELKQQFHSIQSNLSSLLNNHKEYEFSIASRLYGDQKYSFLKEFLDATKRFYGSELEKVDFRHNAESARNLINKWVSSQTNKKITNLIPSGVLDSMTKLVLVNAIYFKGQWLNQFDERLTIEDDFHLSNGGTTKVRFMRQRNIKMQYSVAPNLHSEILEIPFTKDFAFYVVLPNQGTSLMKVEDLLTSDVLASLEFKTTFVNVWLPRFEINKDFELKKFLMKIGIKDIFNGRAADLSGIDGTRMLFVSNALHKAFIKLDEKGIEAAGATAFVIEARSSLKPKIAVDFKADRPFFFYLKDKRKNIISFIGRFNKP